MFLFIVTPQGVKLGSITLRLGGKETIAERRYNPILITMVVNTARDAKKFLEEAEKVAPPNRYINISRLEQYLRMLLRDRQ